MQQIGDQKVERGDMKGTNMKKGGEKRHERNQYEERWKEEA
jgi:hypothetical protein